MLSGQEESCQAVTEILNRKKKAKQQQQKTKLNKTITTMKQKPTGI